MEGIADGRAVDQCYYCALLVPDAAECDHCGHRLRYLPARLVSLEERDQSLTQRLKALRHAKDVKAADDALRWLFEEGPELWEEPEVQRALTEARQRWRIGCGNS